MELIVEEFMDILIADVSDDPTMALDIIPNEEDFYEKFPFKQQREEEEERDRRRREEEEKKRELERSQVP